MHRKRTAITSRRNYFITEARCEKRNVAVSSEYVKFHWNFNFNFEIRTRDLINNRAVEFRADDFGDGKRSFFLSKSFLSSLL